MSFEHKVIEVIQSGANIQKIIEMYDAVGWELQTQSKMLIDDKFIYSLTFKRDLELKNLARLKDLESKIDELKILHDKKLNKEFKSSTRNIVLYAIFRGLLSFVFIGLLFIDFLLVVTFSGNSTLTNIITITILLTLHVLQFLVARWLKRKEKEDFNKEFSKDIETDIVKLVKEAKALR